MAKHRGLDFLRVFHSKNAMVTFKQTGVAHLAAGFGIEGRAV